VIHFGTPAFGNLNSQLLHAHFLPEHFTQSPRSIDACPPTDRRPPTTSTIRASGVSNSYALIPPRVLSPGYNGFPPRIPLDLMVQVLFGSSGFRSFNSYALVPLRSDFTRIQRISTTRPSGSDGPGSLRDFGVRVIRTLQQSVLPEYILPESKIVHHASFPINGHGLLQDFGVQEFLPFHTHFLPKGFHPELMIYRRVSPTNRRLQITSGLRASGVSKYSPTQTSGVQSSQSVRSLDTHPLLSTVRMNSDTSAFGSSRLLPQAFLRSDFSPKW
jgi:hypothetical protein